jgi:hypothetical protein
MCLTVGSTERRDDPARAALGVLPPQPVQLADEALQLAHRPLQRRRAQQPAAVARRGVADALVHLCRREPHELRQRRLPLVARVLLDVDGEPLERGARHVGLCVWVVLDVDDLLELRLGGRQLDTVRPLARRAHPLDDVAQADGT